VCQKEYRLFFADRFVEDPEIEIPKRHPRRHRNGFPIKVVLQAAFLSTNRIVAGIQGGIGADLSPSGQTNRPEVR